MEKYTKTERQREREWDGKRKRTIGELINLAWCNNAKEYMYNIYIYTTTYYNRVTLYRRDDKNVLETRLQPTAAKLNSGLIAFLYAHIGIHYYYTCTPYIFCLLKYCQRGIKWIKRWCWYKCIIYAVYNKTRSYDIQSDKKLKSKNKTVRLISYIT